MYYGLNDPFRNEEFLDMLEYTVCEPRTCHFFHSLVYMTDEDIHRLSEIKRKSKKPLAHTVHLPTMHEKAWNMVALDEIVRRLHLVEDLCNDHKDIIYVYVVTKEHDEASFWEPRFSFVKLKRIDHYNVFMTSTPGPSMDCVPHRGHSRQTHTVLPNGDVYPCQYSFDLREFKMGNILEDDFFAICNSDGYKRLILARADPDSILACKSCFRFFPVEKTCIE